MSEAEHPNQNHKLLLQLLAISLVDLLEHDEDLFTDNVHEQAFSHRLALYIERRFQKALPFFSQSSFDLIKVTVDCEYNRHSQTEKRLSNILGTYPKKKTDIVRPDIVLHVRGKDLNLMVVELSKGSNSDFKYAVDKVLAFVNSDYKYELGAVIRISPDNKNYSQIATIRRQMTITDNKELLSVIARSIERRRPDYKPEKNNDNSENEPTEFRPWSPEVNNYWEDIYNE